MEFISFPMYNVIFLQTEGSLTQHTRCTCTDTELEEWGKQRLSSNLGGFYEGEEGGNMLDGVYFTVRLPV